MGDETEGATLARLREGDTGALELLMERYASRVYRVAYGITQNTADAEEVAQDVFLTLYNKVDTFEERAALGSWLYRVAANAALMKRRTRRSDREISLEPLLPTFRPDGHRNADPELVRADWSQVPDSVLLSQETREVVRRAIDALPDAYRTVVVLRDIEELSNEEVAEAVGESVAAVKSRLHRARMALREELTKHFGPRPDGERSRTRTW